MWLFAAIVLVLLALVPGFRKVVGMCFAILVLVIGCQILKNTVAPHRTPEPREVHP